MPLPRYLPGSSVNPASAGKRDEVKVLGGRYRQENKLGSGAFGCAYLVTDLKANNERKVLKQIIVAELQPDETVDAVREAKLLAKLDHPSIVKFHDSFMEGDFFCIVTEYCEGGDLDAKIVQWREAGRVFGESLIVDWFIQLTTAVKYIHERRILHRDLKTRNIFLKSNLIKLGDFGISRILMGTADMATTFTGTPYYMSPEVLKHEGYNIKSDIWSLGVVLYELCTLQHAFQGQNLMAVMYKIVEGELPWLPDHYPPQLRELFLKMLSKDPTLRPTSTAILQEPFIQERVERWRGKLQEHKQISSLKVAEEAEAIARALSPVKKKNLIPDSGEREMTPKERMRLRKQQRADHEAEERRRLAAKNFSENEKRFKEQKKRQARVIPPWVQEHPDVFNDSSFSITQIDSVSSDITAPTDVAMPGNPAEQPGNSPPPSVNSTQEMSVDAPSPPLTRNMAAEEAGRPLPHGQALIPEDPLLAETHYSQFLDDFESEPSSLSGSEDEYEAFLGAIEDALELPEPQEPDRTEIEPSHDEMSPFTPLARQKRIALLKAQCLEIYGPENFQLVHDYLKSARSASGIVDEVAVMDGLRLLVSNIRDCFLIDQLVFLEKQAETEYAFI